jgi:AraC family transcriptional regulator
MDSHRFTLAKDRQEHAINFTQFMWASDPASWSGFGLEGHRIGTVGALREFDVPDVLLGLCVGGCAQMEFSAGSDAQRATMRPGNFILLNRGAQQRSIAWSGTRETVYIRFAARQVQRLLPHLAQGEHLTVTPQYAASDPQVLRLAKCMFDEVRDGCPTGAAYGESLSLALGSYVFGRYSAHKALSPNGSTLTRAKMAEITNYVQANLGRDVTLVELAGVVGLSPHYFLHVFKKSFGVTPHHYLLRERVEQAKRLLKRDGCAISDVGQLLGFSDQSHFTATFRRVTGTTPRRYRNAES